MYIFFGLVLIVVIVAYIRVKNAKGEIESIDHDIPAPANPRKRKKSSEDEWWYQGQGENIGSDHSGFDGGGSHDGGGSSTHF
jgi:uncharacterized membrane protein YgcG